MFALLRFFLALFSSLFKSKSRLEADNAALRCQLIVLQRKVRGRVHFTNSAAILDPAVSMVSIGAAGHHCDRSRDARALASNWLSPLLWENMMANEELPVIAKFEVRRRAYIAPDGTVLRDLPDFADDQNLVVSMYRGIALARAFDLKAVSLQRTGRLGTYATSLGQEAVAVGLASAMQPEDVLLPSYRDNAALLWRGVTMEDILLFWGGDERGSHWSGPSHDTHSAFQSVRTHRTQPVSPTR
jgi:hypothetical protein